MAGVAAVPVVLLQQPRESSHAGVERACFTVSIEAERLQVCTNMPVAAGEEATSGCPSRFSRVSFNTQSPFAAAVGLSPAVFALGFSPGPEPKPWDAVKGYPRIFGRTDIADVLFANYGGAAACDGAGAYAVQTHRGVRTPSLLPVPSAF